MVRAGEMEMRESIYSIVNTIFRNTVACLACVAAGEATEFNLAQTRNRSGLQLIL